MAFKETDLRRCQKRDKKAQRLLYTSYERRIMGVCRRYASNYDEAKDIFQEAFIKIFSQIDKLREFKYLEKWMIRTAVNTAINYYHSQRRHNDNLSYDVDDQFNDNDESIISQLSNEQLVEIVNELPDGFRLVFNLYVIEGFKHKEIAEMLSISENTSKSQLNRAKQALKQKLRFIGIDCYEKYG